MRFFETQKIEDCITCIKSVKTGEFMYLFEGTEKAILLDTGLGFGNIKEYVQGLTRLPYDVILSHGHHDHIGGSFLYESAYINPKDIPVFKEYGDMKMRSRSLKYMADEHNLSKNDFVPTREIELLPINHGDLFELGGQTIEVIEAPGHTPGTLCFLLREKRILFSGDACNNCSYLFMRESLPIQEYQKTVRMLLDRGEEYDRVLLSHWRSEVPKSIIQDVYDCCTDIMEGNADDEPYGFMDIEAYVAKKRDHKGERVDGKIGNVIYRKDNIFSRG